MDEQEGSRPVEYQIPDHMAVIRISPQTDRVVTNLAAEANRLREYAEARTITGPDDVKRATEDLSMMANLKKALVAKKSEYILPIQEHQHTLTVVFGLWLFPIEEADRITRAKILAYRKAEADKAAAIEHINALRLEAARAEAAMSGTGEITESVNLIPEVAPPARKVQTEVGSLGTAKLWKFEVVDATLVPRDYLAVDEVKIGKVVRALKLETRIPGIDPYDASGVSAGAA